MLSGVMLQVNEERRLSAKDCTVKYKFPCAHPLTRNEKTREIPVSGEQTPVIFGHRGLWTSFLCADVFLYRFHTSMPCLWMVDLTLRLLPLIVPLIHTHHSWLIHTVLAGGV